MIVVLLSEGESAFPTAAALVVDRPHPGSGTPALRCLSAVSLSTLAGKSAGGIVGTTLPARGGQGASPAVGILLACAGPAACALRLAPGGLSLVGEWRTREAITAVTSIPGPASEEVGLRFAVGSTSGAVWVLAVSPSARRKAVACTNTAPGRGDGSAVQCLLAGPTSLLSIHRSHLRRFALPTTPGARDGNVAVPNIAGGTDWAFPLRLTAHSPAPCPRGHAAFGCRLPPHPPAAEASGAASASTLPSEPVVLVTDSPLSLRVCDVAPPLPPLAEWMGSPDRASPSLEDASVRSALAVASRGTKNATHDFLLVLTRDGFWITGMPAAPAPRPRPATTQGRSEGATDAGSRRGHHRGRSPRGGRGGGRNGRGRGRGPASARGAASPPAPAPVKPSLAQKYALPAPLRGEREPAAAASSAALSPAARESASGAEKQRWPEAERVVERAKVLEGRVKAMRGQLGTLRSSFRQFTADTSTEMANLSRALVALADATERERERVPDDAFMFGDDDIPTYSSDDDGTVGETSDREFSL